jgi:hypothetical protein
MPTVTAALVAGIRALPTMSTVVVDKANVITGSSYDEAVVIGDDGDPESDVQSVFQQVWVDMAHTRRDETGDIPCVALAQTGSTAPEVVEARAFEILGYVELMVVADPTLGGTVATLEILGGSSKIIQNARGSAVIVPFSVRYWTHL